ncbi:uncharacterized protein M6B38_270395 [Iris pallida]|uniref:Uncharacterized protein n=1 Tax=Iris pallida TaxID=29817 RepID=A0AAX6I9G3_IRIPA|nr:uncharacterized protein M6B38_270395 [Iris pallida]
MEETTHSNSSKLSTTSSEESGWSLYIEDFLASSKREAAAAAEADTSRRSTTTSCVMLKRKRKARGEGELHDHDDDDPLEDTATSHKEDGAKCMKLRKDRGAELGFVKGVAECNELRKRGLCLVPVSMLLDYLG